MESAGASWRDMRRCLRADALRSKHYQESKFGYVPLTWFLDPGWACVFLHRFAHVSKTWCR